MPYAPVKIYDPSALQQGFSDLGAGIARYNQNKEQMDALDTAAQLIARQHPDAVDPDMLDKFSKGSLGQRQALVGQMTAAVADKYKQQQMAIEQQHANTQDFVATTRNQREIDTTKQQQDVLNFSKDRFMAEQNSEPNTITDAQGNQFMYMPGSKQTPVQTNKKEMLLPEPPAIGADGKPMVDADGRPVPAPWETHNGPDGKPVTKSRWNPYTGKTETISLRESAANPLAALLGGGGGDASANTGTGAAAAPPPGSGAGAVTPPPATAAKYQAGKVYVGRDGSKARYNADGSWTRVQ